MKINLLALILLAFTLNCSAQLPVWLPSNGLVAWYPFNGNANDLSTHGFNGTVNAATLTTDRFGNTNAAYSFNGTSGNISVADNSLLRLNGTDFTISAWIYNNAVATTNLNAIISKRTTSLSSGYILGIEGATLTDPGHVIFQVSGGTNPKAISTDSMPLNVWNNYMIVYNHSTQNLSLYINGILDTVASGIPTPSATATAALWIGNDVSGSPYCFNGKIDDIAIYNRSLSECERNQLINTSVITITTQPANHNYAIGDTAIFFVASPDTCLNYQWQRDCGSGYSDLQNVGVYSGVNNDTLIIGSVPLSFNNCSFRCIVGSCVSCADTSDAAVLNVTAGINDFEKDGGISIYPNPTNDFIQIEMREGKYSEVIIYNNVGAKVIVQPISSNTKNFKINTSGLSKGVYYVEMKSEKNIMTRKLIKI